MKVSEETSQKIKNMSIICAMLVVTIHVDWPHDAFSFTWLIHEFIRDGIARIAVPFFFVVSGFFLSKHMSEPNWYGSEIKKRCYSLLIPFVVWTVIATILVTPLSIIADIIAHRPFGYTPGFTNGRWIETFGLDPRHGPNCLGALWYVRCLFCFVLLAPIFKWLVGKGKFIWLACAFTLTLSHASWAPFPPYLQNCFSLGFSLSGVFYFSIGIFLGLSKSNTLSKLAFTICALTGFTLLVCKTMLSFNNVDLHVSLMTIAIPFLMYSVWYLTPSSKWPSAFTSSSFPIFLMHMPLIPYFSLPIKHSPLCGSQIGSLIIFLGASLSSVCIAVILRKYFPRINSFLFVGRS